LGAVAGEGIKHPRPVNLPEKIRLPEKSAFETRRLSGGGRSRRTQDTGHFAGRENPFKLQVCRGLVGGEDLAAQVTRQSRQLQVEQAPRIPDHRWQ
jgi:hypothetical protein